MADNYRLAIVPDNICEFCIIDQKLLKIFFIFSQEKYDNLEQRIVMKNNLIDSA